MLQHVDNYFEKHLPPLLRHEWIKHSLKNAMSLDAIFRFQKEMHGLSGFEAVEAPLQNLGFSIEHRNVERIPATGRLLVLANHPVGAADVFILLHCLRQVREDVRVVINKVGTLLVPQLAEFSIPVDRYSQFDPPACRLIGEALEQEQAVILFPAGGISKVTPFGIRDHIWKPGAVHFIRQHNADYLPVHISGRSSLLFLSMPRKLRHFFVAREFLNPVRQKIIVTVGHPLPHHALAAGDPRTVARELQQSVYALKKQP